MNRSSVLFGSSILLVTAGAVAQQKSLVLFPDTRMVLLNASGASLLEDIDDQNSYIVTPNPSAPYEALPYHTFASWNIQYGDGDSDGDLADATNDIMGTGNVLFVRNMTGFADTVRYPGDIFVSGSFNTTTGVATSTMGAINVLDGDCYRARNGTIEFFVRESQLATAMGDPLTDIDLDALCQTTAGDIFFSITDNGVVAGATTYNEEDVMFVPVSAITYDAAGLITSIAAGSAVIVARDADFAAMILNSGSVNQSGTTSGTGDITGLELDPNGGSWTSPNYPFPLPNILFCSNFSVHFDNIWSTAAGGSLAVINGVQIGYTSGFANGTATGVGISTIGTPPQDGLNGLCLVDAASTRDWIACEALNSGRPVAGQFQVDVGRLVPGTPAAIVFGPWTNDFAGGWVDGTPAAAFGFGGNPFLDISIALPTISIPIVGDASGYATLSFTQPVGVPTGVDVIGQTAGFAFGEPGILTLGQSTNLTTL